MLELITKMVSAHPAVHHVYWEEQGKAPLGLYKGMALSYGRVYCKYKLEDPAALFCGKANTHNSTKDALSHYAGFFADEKLSNDKDGVDTLRHLWVLLTGVAMPESSGNCFCGVDVTNENSLTHADGAEAGLFQTSWDSHTASPLLPPLFSFYETLTDLSDTWLDVFREGVPSISVHNVGTGTGANFQNLSKVCPPFSAEYAAVVLRCLRGHYGTVNRYEAQLNPQLDDLFQQVEKIINTNFSAFSKALLGSKYKGNTKMDATDTPTVTPVALPAPKAGIDSTLSNVFSSLWTKDLTNLWSGLTVSTGTLAAALPTISQWIGSPAGTALESSLGLTPYMGVITAAFGVITFLAKGRPATS